jgi:hypothetical protein
LQLLFLFVVVFKMLLLVLLLLCCCCTVLAAPQPTFTVGRVIIVTISINLVS